MISRVYNLHVTVIWVPNNVLYGYAITLPRDIYYVASLSSVPLYSLNDVVQLNHLRLHSCTARRIVYYMHTCLFKNCALRVGVVFYRCVIVLEHGIHAEEEEVVEDVGCRDARCVL